MARFFKFGLIVTGKGEQQFLPTMLRALTSAGNSHFRVLRKVDQRSPRTDRRRELRMVGRGSVIPDKDCEEIGLPARRYLQDDESTLVLVVDDLEGDRKSQRDRVYRRYREALDHTLGPHYSRASVHFLVNMLEAYYFADPRAVREALGIELAEPEGDVEEIRHPKNELKRLARGFDEVTHGHEIVSSLDLERVLSNPQTCGSLRVLVRWCMKKMGENEARFCLATGIYDRITGSQLSDSARSLESRR